MDWSNLAEAFEFYHGKLHYLPAPSQLHGNPVLAHKAGFYPGSITSPCRHPGSAITEFWKSSEAAPDLFSYRSGPHAKDSGA